MLVTATTGHDRGGDPGGGGHDVVRCRWRPGRPTVRTALALLWILDAALQYQPTMFGRGLVAAMMLPAAHGQPAPIAWTITTLAHFVLPDVGVWNFLFATTQLAIGIGLLVPRARRGALVLMVAWAAAVWWFGEGLGGVLTGGSPLGGAPGAVVLYGVLGIALWPSPAEDVAWSTGRTRRIAPLGTGVRWDALARQLTSGAGLRSGTGTGPSSRALSTGVASSAAAGGRWRHAALAGWTAWWLLSAVLWLVPPQRTPGAVAASITAMAGGQPSWYASFLVRVGHAFGSIGPQTAWLLALGSLVVGFGPWLSRRPTRYLVAGAALALCFWVTGEALGGILTGMGTDPNAGPLVVLLAVSLLPHTVPARLDVPLAARSLLASRPVLTTAGAGALAVVLLLSATYPTAPSAVTTRLAAGSTGKQAAGSVSSTVTTPGMAAMPGMPGGGGSREGRGPRRSPTGATTAHGGVAVPWSYTGPPLPPQEVSLLTTVFNDTEKGHQMQTPNCTATPTVAQEQAAFTLVQQTSQAVARYQSLAAAIAAGYVPITNPGYPVVHYIDPAYLKAKDVLDPQHVQALVYAFTPYGPVLAAAMYLMPAAGLAGPMPGGCLTQWHTHTNLCAGPTGIITGFEPCAPGLHPALVPEMLHVWQLPVPGGALTMDPSDLQVVEAAIMAQLHGQAPVASPSGTSGPGRFATGTTAVSTHAAR